MLPKLCVSGTLSVQASAWKAVILLASTIFAVTGQAAVPNGLPSDTPTGPELQYYLTVQLGGEDAHAVTAVLQLAEKALLNELNEFWDGCQVFNAWNLSECDNGSPIAAPFHTVSDQGLLSVINSSPAPSPVIFAQPVTASETKQGRRFLLHDAIGAPDSLPAAVPSSSRCLPQMDVVFQLLSKAAIDDAKLNQTALPFINGAFLANMQANNVRLEQAVLLNLTAAGSGVQPNAFGQAPGNTQLYTFGQQPNTSVQNPTEVQMILSLVGQDAKVANNDVLEAFFSMVIDPGYNGNSPWLTGANTAIVDLRQEHDVNISPNSSAGRRRLLSLVLHSEPALIRPRRLAQSMAPTPATSKSALAVNQPALAVTLQVRGVPDSEVSTVKDAANLLVSGSQLVEGFRTRSINIVAVDLINFNYTATPKPPPLVISPRNSHRTIVILILAIVIPVCVVGAIFIGCSIVWWGRLSQGKLDSYKTASSLGFNNKARPDSELSSESLAMLNLDPLSSSPLLESNAGTTAQIQLLDMPWNDWKIEPSELTILTKPDGNKWLLGTGASGTVYKALRNGVQIVAVKLFKEEVTRGAINSLNSWGHAAQFRREISILKSCHDRNIVQFIGACLAEGQTSLVTEFLENGDLYRAINSAQGTRFHWYRLTSPDGRVLPNSGMAKRVALDVARGLHFLHTRKIVHFDLKSANILLARDFTAKIADVGLAKVLHDDVMSARREVGTFAWAAPEVLLGHTTTEAADIYSFGVLLHELSAQESPRDRQLRKLRVPEEVPSDINSLILRCLHVRAEERPTARDLVALLSCMIVPLCP